MNRVVEIDIAGKTWPICLTLKAFSDIYEKYESLSKCLEKLDELVKNGDNIGLIDEYTWLLDCLLWACKTAEDQDYENTPPNQERLKDLFSPGDVPYIQRKVLECIQLGQSREVGAEPPKNGEGAEE